MKKKKEIKHLNLSIKSWVHVGIVSSVTVNNMVEVDRFRSLMLIRLVVLEFRLLWALGCSALEIG